MDFHAKGIITTPGKPFTLSHRKEIDELLAQGIFELISNNSKEISNTRIFGSRMIDKVKGKETTMPYKKSHLVIQAFNDEGKKAILTQSPTIQ